jgi:hypothetical protein
MANTHPVNSSIREVDDNSWIIANKLLLSRQRSPPLDRPSWSDGDGSFFALSEAISIPESRPLS